MLVSPLVRKGASQQFARVGDILNSLYKVGVSQTAGGDATQVVTGEMIARGDVFIIATTGAHDVTMPTADQILNAIRGNLNKLAPPSELYVNDGVVETEWPAFLQSLDHEISFLRTFYSRNAGGANTLVVQASSGLTLADLAGVSGGAVALATNTWHDLEFVIKNATPSVIAAGATTAAAYTLTLANPAIARQVTPGMSAYLSSDAGWDAAGTKVTQVDRENGILTMADAAANTAALVAVTLTPTIICIPKKTGTIVAASLA